MVAAEKSSTANDLKGQKLKKRYRLDQLVSTGGLAEIWHGVDLILERDVAIKVLHPHLADDEATVKRFRDGSVAAAQLSHPNIIPTFDAGTQDKVAFSIGGLVTGPTLFEVLTRRGLSPFEAASLSIQLASAIEYAHKCGACHKDLNPRNIVLVDNERRLLISDFGIGHALSSSEDESPTLPGISTPMVDFIAPEAAEGHFSEKSDIYSIGIILHEMVCRHTLLSDVGELNHALLSDPNSKCNRLPDDLAEIIRNCTKTDPEQRIDASQLLAALYTCSHNYEPDLSPSEAPRDSSDTATMFIPAMTPQKNFPSAEKESIALQQRQEILEARRANGRLWRHTAIVVIALMLIALFIGRIINIGVDAENDTATTVKAKTVQIASVDAFDPAGDGTESESLLKNLADGDTSTSWNTELYSSNKFGNLKPGVGFILTTNSPKNVSSIVVNTSTPGWNAEIFRASSKTSSFNQWGSAVARIDNAVKGDNSVTLPESDNGAILFWFTSVANDSSQSGNLGFRNAIGEVTLKT